ncbi:CpsD/CapB family tyrosine-protein kinase [Candidatus Chlorohelix sp.]|uniref:CpsD/CapB family tyrosine-protein kinase n=1 Tax=Candidatus Chlorohelix sp. TaxID=3139201 RepID=UPI00302DB662
MLGKVNDNQPTQVGEASKTGVQLSIEPVQNGTTKSNLVVKTGSLKPKKTTDANKFALFGNGKRETQLNEEFYHRIQQEFRATPEVGDPLVVGITSSVRGEGRTTTSVGLASAIAQSIPQPIVLLEGDLSRPNLAEELGIENVGLSEYLRGEIPLESVARLTALADLWIIPAGDCLGQDLKTLRSERLAKLFSYLRQEYAAIIVDMPPIEQTAQAARLSGFIDRILLVALAGSTPKGLIQSSLATIPIEKQAGVILNKTTQNMPRLLKNLLGV